MATDSPPTAISRLPSGARTKPGALRHGWRGCGGIARVLTGKHTHAAHTHAPNTPFNRPNACRKIRDKGVVSAYQLLRTGREAAAIASLIWAIV